MSATAGVAAFVKGVPIRKARRKLLKLGPAQRLEGTNGRAMADRSDADEDLIRAIDQAEEFSYSSDDNSQLANDRARAIDYYMGTNLDPAPEGRSQVMDRSVFETIQWILPSLVRIFANGDDVVSISPIGPEDEKGAKQEAQYLNHIALKKTPWFQTLIDWFTDALLTRNAYVYVYKDYKRNIEIEHYERQTKQGLLMLTLGPNGKPNTDIEILSHREYPDPDGGQEPQSGPDGQPMMQPAPMPPEVQQHLQQVMQQAQAQGQQLPDLPPPPMQPVMGPSMLYDVTLRRTETEGRYCIDVLPPERCKVSHRTPNFRLESCPYFEYYEYDTISNLRLKGYDVEDDIQDSGDDDDLTLEAYSRNRFMEQTGDDRPEDPAMRRVKVRTIWIQHDYDGDGIAEMQRCIRVGREVLEREEVGRIHVASIVPIVLPHRHVGLSAADAVMEIQDIKRAILRGGLDNLYLSNNARMGVTNKVNLDDVLISRPGQPIRVDTDAPDAAGHIFPVTQPFIFPQAIEALQYMSQVTENRSGVNSNFTGLDQNALAPSQSGVAINQLTTMAAQRVELIARIFAVGVLDVFSILHEVILKSGHKKEVVQMKGEWVEVDPATWKKRKDFDVTVGYAAGNKDSMVQKLMLIATKQIEALQLGLPVVQPSNYYETLVELTKAADFSSPDRFWSDPKNAPPKPPPPPDPIIVQAQIKAQADAQAKQLQAQHDQAALLQKEQESVRDATLKKYIADQTAQVQLITANQEAEHQKFLERMRGEHQAGLAAITAALNPQTTEAKTGADTAAQHGQLIDHVMNAHKEHAQRMETMMDGFTRTMKSLAGPKKILRDKAGKATGVAPMNGSAE